MLIAVAGPYSAPTEAGRQANLDAMNAAAVEVFKRGHVPVIGMNNALPVVDRMQLDDAYGATMEISLAVVERCDAILVIGRSHGVDLEIAALQALGRPVYWSLSEVPGEL